MRFVPGGFIVLYPEGVESHFQFGGLVAGDLLEPGRVAGGVLVAAFPRLPDALHHGHGHVRAKAGRETQRVPHVVVAALGKVDARKFGVRYFVISDRGNDAGVKRAHGYHVLERGAHGVAGEALHVADHHLVGGGAEGAAQGLNFGRGGAAAGRGVGLVRHEHRVRRYLFFFKPVDALQLGHELLHNGGDVFGVQAGDVEGGVGALGEEEPGERHHAAAAGKGLVLYHHADGGGAGDQAVAAQVEGQSGLGDVLLGGGGAGGEEAGHGPALHLAVGHVVGGYHHDALALAGADPGFRQVDGLGGGGAGGADMDSRAFGPHPLRELAVRYRYHLQQEILAESVGVFRCVIMRQLLLQPFPELGLVALTGELVHYGMVQVPELGGVLVGVLVVEVAGGFLYHLLGGGEGRREHHAGLGGQRFGQRPFLGQVAAGGGLLVIMDQRQARVLHRQDAGAYGHLERRAEGLGHGVRQAEFLLYIQVPHAGGKFYGLVHRVDLLYGVVARRGFHHADDVFVYLLCAPCAGDGLYHVLTGEDLVQVMLPEQAVPGAGRAAGYAGDRQRIEVEAVALGESGLVRGQRRRGTAG